jgi:hypothetical protein
MSASGSDQSDEEPCSDELQRDPQIRILVEQARRLCLRETVVTKATKATQAKNAALKKCTHFWKRRESALAGVAARSRKPTPRVSGHRQNVLQRSWRRNGVFATSTRPSARTSASAWAK